MKKLIVAALAAFLMIGCSSTPQEKSASALIEMQMLKKKYLKDHVPAGMGIGVSTDEQIAYEKAGQNARVDLAQVLEARVKALIKNFKEDVNDQVAEHFQSTSKTVVDTRMSGATLTDAKVETDENGHFKVYGIMTLDADLVAELIKSLQAAGQYDDAVANKIREAANKAYAELDAEIEKQ